MEGGDDKERGVNREGVSVQVHEGFVGKRGEIFKMDLRSRSWTIWCRQTN